MTNCAISAVIPYFRNRSYIEEVIRSLCRSFSRAGLEGEILVVDDASGDGVASEYSTKASHFSLPVRWISLPVNGGVSRARNRGAEEAKYDLVLFVDSDVAVSEDSLAHCRELLASDTNLDAVTGVYDPRSSGKEFFSRFLSSYATFSWINIQPQNPQHETAILWSQFLLVRKRSFQQVGGFDVSKKIPCLEDVEFSIRMGITPKRMVLDKRIQTTHLKEYTLVKLLNNYFSKAVEWVKIKSVYKQFEYRGYENIDKKLSLIATVLSPLLFFHPAFLVLVATLFLWANRAYLSYVTPIHGWFFSLKAAAFLFVVNGVTLGGVGISLSQQILGKLFFSMRRYGRLLKNYLFKPFGSIESLTLFVTNKCNYDCYYCCYASHLNKKEEVLTLEELDLVSKKTGNFENLIITGGEPFLRKDLVSIVHTFYENSGVRKVSIISNGSMPARVRKDIVEILQLCPEIHIILNFSFEGSEAKQDEVRGKGSYRSFVKSVLLLRDVSTYYARLKVEHIYTFHKTNQNTLLHDVREQTKQEGTMITMNLQRGYAGKPFVEDLNIDEYNRISEILYESNRKNSYRFLFSEVIRNAKRLAQKLNYLTYKDRAFKTPCYAGRLNVTLYNSGQLTPCELLESSYGNVRDNHYEISEMLRSSEARNITRPIIREKCFCTHECNQMTNVLFNPRYLFQLLFSRKGRGFGLLKSGNDLPNILTPEVQTDPRRRSIG